MALNFQTGSRSSTEDAPEATEPDSTPTNTSSEAEPSTTPPRRRSTRASRSQAPQKAAPATETTEDESTSSRRTSTRRPNENNEDSSPRPTRRRTPATKKNEEEATSSPRPSRRRTSVTKANEKETTEQPKRATPRRRPRTNAPTAETEAELLSALKEQTETLTRLVNLQEQTIERLSGNGGGATATLPRVGVFVDSANVELARDRGRPNRPIDWGRVLEHLTEGRRLVRAIAYSPVHDDPGVSRETQRFVEPFLGKGYKIVTKPLKRFADGSIKANVDIELALDAFTMSDRLDIAVLISGDGDFQHLVEVLQGRGIRVEVAGLGASVAGNLKKAADRYIELDFAQKK